MTASVGSSRSAKARREKMRGIGASFNRNDPFSKRLDIWRQLFYWSKAVGFSGKQVKVAERDGIWSRGGIPVEMLPDPFAPEPRPSEELPGAGFEGTTQ